MKFKNTIANLFYRLHFRLHRSHFHFINGITGLPAPLSAEEEAKALEQLAQGDAEHRTLLERIAPEEFDVLHYAAMTVLKRRS